MTASTTTSPSARAADGASEIIHEKERMLFDKRALDVTIEGYRSVCAYLAEIRSFYEVVNARLATGECGVALASLGPEKLFSSVTSYSLPGDAGQGEMEAPRSSPGYMWFPNWLGSFYLNRNRNHGNGAPDSGVTWNGLMGFVWVWIGLDDAYVADAVGPECWIGIGQLSERPADSAISVAQKVWRFFRVEWTMEGEVDQWLTGAFTKIPVGLDLNGRWFLRRIPLHELSSHYRILKLVVRPLCQKFSEVMTSAC